MGAEVASTNKRQRRRWWDEWMAIRERAHVLVWVEVVGREIRDGERQQGRVRVPVAGGGDGCAPIAASRRATGGREKFGEHCHHATRVRDAEEDEQVKVDVVEQRVHVAGERAEERRGREGEASHALQGGHVIGTSLRPRVPHQPPRPLLSALRAMSLTTTRSALQLPHLRLRPHMCQRARRTGRQSANAILRVH